MGSSKKVGRNGTMERPSWWIDYFISTLLLTLQQGGHSYPRVLRQKKKKKKGKGRTYTNRPPRPKKHTFRPPQQPPRILHHRMDRQRRKPHRRQRLEHRALRHHRTVVLDQRDRRRVRPRRQRPRLVFRRHTGPFTGTTSTRG